MRKFSILLLSLLFVIPTYAQDPIILGTKTVLVSKIMAEDRQYMVHLPPSYDASDDTYPVIYLLDGDIHRFKSVVGVLESLSTETLERQVQESIVVAIPNTNRVRDFTPTSLKQWTFKGRVLDKYTHTGNAPQFAKFLAQELIPAIENNYRTSEKRVLVGESFGGLFAANILLESHELFTSYLIIDPTSLWDNDYLNRTLDARTNEFKFDSDV